MLEHIGGLTSSACVFLAERQEAKLDSYANNPPVYVSTKPTGIQLPGLSPERRRQDAWVRAISTEIGNGARPTTLVDLQPPCTAASPRLAVPFGGPSPGEF